MTTDQDSKHSSSLSTLASDPPAAAPLPPGEEVQVKPLHKSPFSGPKQPLPVARHLLEPGLRQQQGAVAVAEYSQEEVGTAQFSKTLFS